MDSSSGMQEPDKQYISPKSDIQPLSQDLNLVKRDPSVLIAGAVELELDLL